MQAWPFNFLKQSKPSGGRDDTRTMRVCAILDAGPPTTPAAMTHRILHPSRPPATILARLMASLRAVIAALTRSYHPERHYMRGGGTGGVA